MERKSLQNIPEEYLEPTQISTMELKAIDYFRKNLNISGVLVKCRDKTFDVNHTLPTFTRSKSTMTILE